MPLGPCRGFPVGSPSRCQEEILASRASHGVGIGLGDLAPLPGGRPLERLHPPRLVDVDDQVELVCKTCPEEVALPLRLRAIDDADGPLQAGRAKRIRGPRSGCEPQQELLVTDLVEDLLDAARQGRPHPLALCWTPPSRPPPSPCPYRW